MKRALAIGSVVAIILVAIGAWFFTHSRPASADLTLYGNIDLREVDLAFNNTERISAVLVREGDRVKKGQILARVDVSRLNPELDQARANVALSKSDLANVRRQYLRLVQLWRISNGKGLSREDLDNAKSAATAASARLQANEATFALLRQERADADLAAPMDAVVRSRVMEPGEMASPQRPVLALAITDPKWVRVYVGETDLGKIHPGMAARVSSDTYPNRRFTGWVGFISPTAEFTPKNIETPDLRTNLVYEVRVFVDDHDDVLRLGMPATVSLTLAPKAQGAQ